MEQKVSPIGLRVGIIRDWEPRRYVDKDYANLLLEDVKIHESLFAGCKNASVSRVEIEHSKNRVGTIIRTARPGVIIGTNGENVEMLKKKVEKSIGGKNIYLKVLETTNPDLDTKLVVRSTADQLEQHASFRTAQRKVIQRTMRVGVKGTKTAVSGCLGGADMVHAEGHSEGVVPLHTLRTDIDYAWEEVSTAYGRLGVKVRICRGEALPGQVVRGPEAPRNNMSDRRRSRHGNCGGNRNNSQRNNNNRNSTGGNAPRKTEGGKQFMLIPRRTKYRRPHRLSYKGHIRAGREVSSGEYGLMADTSAYVSNRQIEVVRIAMTRYMKCGDKVWIRIFPHTARTKKPLGVRTGSGKGAPKGWVTVVKPGRVMFEVAGIPEEVAREASRLATHKLSVKTKFVVRKGEKQL